jgi:hypothetical protein
LNRSFLCLIFIVLFIATGNTQTPLRIQERGYYVDETSGDKRPASETLYQYDASGKVRIIQNNSWHQKKQRLGPDNRKEYTYDPQGRIVKEINYFWLDQRDSISLTRIYESEYDNKGKLKVYSISERYYTDPEVYTYTFLYTYSEEGCLVRMDYQARLNDMGNNDYTVLYTVDSQCRTLLKQTSYSDPFSSPSFETFDYDGDNLIANRLYTIQGTDTILVVEDLYAYNILELLILEQRTNQSRIETQYDQEGRKSIVTKYHWSQQLNDWVDPNITTYLYNDQGLLQELRSSFIYSDGSYHSVFKYEYNDLGKETRIYSRLDLIFEDDLVLLYEYETLINYRCDGVEQSREFYTLEAGSKKLSSLTTIVYQSPAPCEQLAEQNFQIYPNPTTGPVTLVPAQPLESYVIRIFNSSGQFIREYTSDQGITPAYMDFSALPSGLYIVTINGESYIASTRLVRN